MAEGKRGELMTGLFGSDDEESEEEHELARQGSRRAARIVEDDERESNEEEEERRQADSDEEAGPRQTADSENEGSEGGGAQQRRSPSPQSDQEAANNVQRDVLKEAGLDSSDEEEEAGSPQRARADTPVPEEEEEEGGVVERDRGLEDDISEDSAGEDRRQKREKPKGPPLHLKAPLQPPLADPSKLYVVRTSNIVDIVPEEFDREKYEREEPQLDETGKMRVKLDDNVIRWRYVRRSDGSYKRESNARFVKWDDGSLHLVVGNEVLAVQVQSMKQDQAHLFLRHTGLGLIQGQGRLNQKMKMMPSSLDSKSHRKLTALLDAKHKKVFKVKTITTVMDPEKEKIEREKLEEERETQKLSLARRQEREMRKYEKVPPRGNKGALSSDYLEALEEEEEDFQDMLTREAEAERRIQRAKREAPPPRAPPPKRPERPKSRRERLEEDSEDEMEEKELSEPEEEEEEDEEEEAEDEEVARERKRREAARKEKGRKVASPPRAKAADVPSGVRSRRQMVLSDSEDED